jgi:alpha-L-rhamnosidase
VALLPRARAIYAPFSRPNVIVILAVLLFGPWVAARAAEPTPVELRVNDVVAPIGLDAGDAANLRFSWVIAASARAVTQSAYQVLVASSRQALDENRGDWWDSGKVTSAHQNGIAYAGKPLPGKTAAWWKVRVWDGNGRAGDWSQPALFETGIVDARKDWQGVFVGGLDAATKTSFNLIRSEFSLPAGKTISRARVYLAAEVFSRSYWDFRINGQRADDTVIMRDGYFTFDVTQILQPGAANAIGIQFGERGEKARQWLCDLDVWFTDGTRLTVGTDAACKGLLGGPVLKANELDGENYDARKEAEIEGWDRSGFRDDGWMGVQVFAGARKPDAGHQRDAVRIHATLPAVALTEPQPGVRIFDLGRNISGWVRLKVKGKPGTVVTLRFAERVKVDGSLDRSSNSVGEAMKAEAVDCYTLKGGEEETWEPCLTFHGFRFVEVTGDVKLERGSIAGRWIHSDILRQATEFSCSDELLNEEFDAFRTGELDNSMYLHIDCNQRGERAPWSADAYACSGASMALFDSANFWQKWIGISNRRVGPHGESDNVLTHGQPGGFALLWQAQCVFIPWDFHQAYGDMAALVPAYERSRQFADCFINWFDPLDEVECRGNRNNMTIISNVNHHDYLIEAEKPWRDEGGKNTENPFWYWGDWCFPRPETASNKSPHTSALTSMYYFRCVDLVAKEAAMLGRADDAAKYAAVADKVKTAVNARYLAPNGNRFYASNRQTLNALALSIGIVPDEFRAAVAQSLADDIRAKTNHLDTGVIGTLHLLRALTDTGHDDTALALAQQATYPSWGYMLRAPQAPGTFWENWGNTDKSKNHPFLGGSLATWLLESVAGIRPVQPGYAEIEFKPCSAAMKKLTRASASITTVRGDAAIQWHRRDTVLTLEVTVPANSRARIYIPADRRTATVREGDSVIWSNQAFQSGVTGIESATATNGYVLVEAGSGQYRFLAK